jgi:hypothetical protein
MSKKGTKPSLSYNIEPAKLGDELGSCFATWERVSRVLPILGAE